MLNAVLGHRQTWQLAVQCVWRAQRDVCVHGLFLRSHESRRWTAADLPLVSDAATSQLRTPKSRSSPLCSVPLPVTTHRSLRSCGISHTSRAMRRMLPQARLARIRIWFRSGLVSPEIPVWPNNLFAVAQSASLFFPSPTPNSGEGNLSDGPRSFGDDDEGFARLWTVVTADQRRASTRGERCAGLHTNLAEPGDTRPHDPPEKCRREIHLPQHLVVR